MGCPTGMKGPGGSSASAPFVAFSMSIAGSGETRFTIWQLNMASSGMGPLNTPSGPVRDGRGAGVGSSGVMKVQVVSAGSFKNPACTSSVTVIVELVGALVVHWKFTNPSGPVVLVAVDSVAPLGSTQVAGVGATSAVMVQSSPGWRSSTAGSGFWSTSLAMLTDGAHSWKAA